ncbi:MAG: hypothetical protein DIU78_005715 [Pseudomonadota bacterium]|nr:MAG: hypothetical protein DIU78_16965 [Pseudomonadota bacterium]
MVCNVRRRALLCAAWLALSMLATSCLEGSACIRHTDCPSGETCRAGVCRLPPPPASAEGGVPATPAGGGSPSTGGTANGGGGGTDAGAPQSSDGGLPSTGGTANGGGGMDAGAAGDAGSGSDEDAAHAGAPS